jgi:prolyl-tRNA editing enzyme YbaK/EbsC (Cys-tRNA(Pro) deacylase)
MLDLIVRYLRAESVPFRLDYYPSPEHEPTVGHPLRHGGMLVEARFVLVDGSPVVACFPHDEKIDLVALGNALGGAAIEAGGEDVPEQLRGVLDWIPPLGQLFGLPLIVDERVATCSVVTFRGFDESAFFEIPYDDFARQEQPRIASFASAGELPAAPGAPGHAGATPTH